MKALCWTGVNKTAVETVEDPTILNDHDIIVLQHIADGELSTEHLATHVMPLEEGPRGYQMFKGKQDGCVRAVFQPEAG